MSDKLEREREREILSNDQGFAKMHPRRHAAATVIILTNSASRPFIYTGPERFTTLPFEIFQYGHRLNQNNDHIGA